MKVRRIKTRLPEVVGLLHECITLSVFPKTRGERGMRLTEIVGIGVLCFDKAVDGGDVFVEVFIFALHSY